MKRLHYRDRSREGSIANPFLKRSISNQGTVESQAVLRHGTGLHTLFF